MCTRTYSSFEDLFEPLFGFWTRSTFGRVHGVTAVKEGAASATGLQHTQGFIAGNTTLRLMTVPCACRRRAAARDLASPRRFTASPEPA